MPDPDCRPENLIQRQKLFGTPPKTMDMILRPMAEKGQEPNGSMGNDAALAVLSDKAQLLYDYFKQLLRRLPTRRLTRFASSL